MTKSLLFTDDAPFGDVPGCGPCRQETSTTMRKDGRLYRLIMRDKVSVEDPYLVAVKATIFAIKEGVPYPAVVTPRDIRDYLIKSTAIV